ncbi:T7SS effector LXG polymorphic toxin [Listeria newyorkensis]|uniref:LXG domain-containing protein n=1 Tax=Listeria newyorkensis TaxID=1497681 RepID=A0A841Z1X7_9LIST|nr:T7SS effector LXG polymorphic toxin [Listeria newyorkensis]MBC1458843.1 hypothetical protein [Listeria newyorkensis]
MARIDIAEIHNFIAVFIRESQRVQMELEHRKTAIGKFLSDSDIKGNIGDQAKEYYRNVYYPLIDATRNSLVEAEDKLKKYEMDFYSQVDPSMNARLDLARMYELQADMRKYENKIEDVKASVKSTANSMDSIGQSIGLQLGMETALGNFRREEQILEKYEQFEMSHRNVLHDVLSKLHQVKQSLAQIESGTAFDAGTHMFQSNKIKLGALQPKKPKTFNFDQYEKTLQGSYWVLTKNGKTDADAAEATIAYNDGLNNGTIKGQQSETFDFEAEYLKAALEGYDLITGESINQAQSFSIISGIIIGGIAFKGRGRKIPSSHLSKIQSDLKIRAAKDAEMKTFSKKLMATKPMNSPVPDKWIKKGGSISIDGKGTWSYTNTKGQTVKYPNGYPDFSEYRHPGVKPVQIEFANPTSRPNDYKAANIRAGLDKNSIPPVTALNKAPSGYTWHHMEDGKTMMLVDMKVHAEFSHKGGVSLKNNQ